MSHSVQTRHCIHQCLADGFDEFVLQESSRAAVDEFFDHLAKVLQGRHSDQYPCLLLDWRKSGLPPMQYAFQKAQEFNQVYPQISEARTAIIYNYGTLISMTQTFLSLKSSGKSNVRFFLAQQYDEAVEWLPGA